LDWPLSQSKRRLLDEIHQVKHLAVDGLLILVVHQVAVVGVGLGGLRVDARLLHVERQRTGAGGADGDGGGFADYDLHD